VGKAFSKRGELRILQWNCNCVRTQVVELEQILERERVDVCLLQEVKLCIGETSPSFPSFSVVRRDRPAGSVQGGGLLTLVREDVPFSVLPQIRHEGRGVLEELSVVVVGRDRQGQHHQVTIASDSQAMLKALDRPSSRESSAVSRVRLRLDA
jgi:hypothetical protein